MLGLGLGRTSHGARRATALLMCAAVMAAGGAGQVSDASAHSGDPNIQSLVIGVQPRLPGVSIAVIQSIAPALSAVDTARTELEVLGPDGVPFLRLGPRGAEGNLNSAALYLSTAPGGQASVPSRARRAGIRPEWVVLSRRPAWAWFEPRIPDIQAAPPAVRGRTTPSRLALWSVPLRFGVEPARANGVVEYLPSRGSTVARLTSPTLVAPGVTVVLLPGRFPDLLLQNRSRQTVTVIGERGEPFARIGPRGVSVNLRSPVHAADVTERGDTPEIAANPSAPPVFRRVSTAATYDWLDPRAHFQPHWTVPLRIGGRTVDVTGTLTFAAARSHIAPGGARARSAARRPDGGWGTAAVIGPIAAAIAIGLGGAAVHRRRRRRPRAVAS